MSEDLDTYARAVSLLAHASRTSPPLREAVATVEAEVERLLIEKQQIMLDVHAVCSYVDSVAFDRPSVAIPRITYATKRLREAVPLVLDETGRLIDPRAAAAAMEGT